MRCRKVQKLLSLYGDGKLPRRTAEGIETHLADCTGCRCEAAELDEALSALRGVPRLRPAPAFKRAVIAAVRREAVQTRQGAWEWVLVRQPALATVAVTACVLVGAVAIGMHGRQAPLITPVREMIAQSPAEPAEMPVAAEESRPTPVVEPVVVRPRPRARTTRAVMASRHVRPVRPAAPASGAEAEEEAVTEAVAAEAVEEEPTDEASVGLQFVAAAGTYETVKKVFTDTDVGSECVASWILGQPWTLQSMPEEPVASAEGGTDVSHL